MKTGVNRPPPGLVRTDDSSNGAACNTNTYGSYARDEISHRPFSTVVVGSFQRGILCRIGLDRVGTTLLKGTKTAMLLTKLFAFGQIMSYRHMNVATMLVRRRLGVRGMAVVVQECVDLLRQVSRSFVLFSKILIPAVHRIQAKSGDMRNESS